MRILIILWALPLALFWGWYGLSAHDLHFGSIYLSRELHDAVFAVYGETTGIAPGDIPPMLAGASILDSGVIAAIAAFRWRAAWWPQFRARAVNIWSRYGPGRTGDIVPASAE